MRKTIADFVQTNSNLSNLIHVLPVKMTLKVVGGTASGNNGDDNPFGSGKVEDGSGG